MYYKSFTLVYSYSVIKRQYLNFLFLFWPWGQIAAGIRYKDIQVYKLGATEFLSLSSQGTWTG